MKQALNFRLNDQTIGALSILQKKLHCSKTAIIEKAVQSFAKKELAHQHKLLAFAGILNDRDADAMLESIKTEKHNKDLDITL